MLDYQYELIKKHTLELENNGFTVLKNRSDLANPIYSDLQTALNSLCKFKGIDIDNTKDDLHSITSKLAQIDRSIISHLYDMARDFLSTFAIAQDPFISKIAYNYIGSKNLIEQIRDHLIRIDIPTETQGYLTEEEKSEDLNLLLPWHQDYPYNQGSKKSLTIYLPLQEAKVNEGGTLEVAVASHKKGLLKHIKKKRKIFLGERQIESVCYIVPENIVCQYVQKILYLDYSDILIFDMDLIHRSAINLSKKTRFNLQVRLSNLGDEKFCNRYPTIKIKKHLNLTSQEQKLISHEE